MQTRVAYFLLVLPLVAAASACSSSPIQPSATAPVPLQPANGAQISAASQPVTLVVANATTTGSSTLSDTFEVATDSAFTNKVFTMASVAQGTSGQTSVLLGMLSGGADYYWHARVGTGAFGETFKFTVGPAVTLNAPVPVAPANGAGTGIRPTLTVTNSSRQGPGGTTTYKFEIATSAAFSPVVLSGTVNEGVNQTSFVTSELTANQTYFWRATATDTASGVSSSASTVQTFVPSNTAQSSLAAQLGVLLWPGTQPPGTNGHASLGDNWNVQRFIANDGEQFTSPPIDALQVFDVIDRGMDPQAAIEWMHSHGYSGGGVYYSVGVDVIGFEHVYMARNPRSGSWDLIVKVGA